MQSVKNYKTLSGNLVKKPIKFDYFLQKFAGIWKNSSKLTKGKGKLLIALAIICVSNNNIALTKVMAEI